MRRWINLLVATLVFGPALATDWPQWRGPQRDGHAPGRPWPGSLDGLTPLWRVPLGRGYPGPIVAGDRVFVVETVDRETVGARALNRETGEEIWSTSWSGRGSVPFFAQANGDWVRSTPAYDGQTLFVGDMSEVLLALDARTGRERWRCDFPARFGTEVPDFGMASSPLVDGDAVFVQAANSLVKLDKRTGETLWRALEQPPDIASSGAFSSPILATLGGVRQLVVLTRHVLYGVSPETGEQLWSHPVPNFRGMNILTPVVHGDSIFTSPYRGKSHLFKVTRDDGKLGIQEHWTHKSTGYMSSPVLVDGHAYLHLGNQRVECIDLATGEARWRSSESFGKYWSMVHNGDKILALDEAGALHLLRADPAAFELLDSRKVSEQESWGHLAVGGRQLFVRELEAVSAYRWDAQR